MKKVQLSNVISAIEAMERPLDFKLINLMCINVSSVTNVVSILGVESLLLFSAWLFPGL